MSFFYNFTQHSSYALLMSSLSYHHASHSSFHKQIVPRIGLLASTALSPITLIADTSVGIIALLGYVLTLGKFPKLSNFSKLHLHSLPMLLTLPLASLILTFNPAAEFDSFDRGFIAKPITQYFYLDDPKKAKTASRITIIAGLILTIGARTVDTVIGSIAQIIALATFGKFRTINKLAGSALQPAEIINDIIDGCEILMAKRNQNPLTIN